MKMLLPSIHTPWGVANWRSWAAHKFEYWGLIVGVEPVEHRMTHAVAPLHNRIAEIEISPMPGSICLSVWRGRYGEPRLANFETVFVTSARELAEIVVEKLTRVNNINPIQELAQGYPSFFVLEEECTAE